MTICSAALVVNRKTPGEFAPQVIDLLKTFATQSALAIQNARLFREIEDEEPRAGDGEPSQERISRQHVARAAHAAQRHHRLLGSVVRAHVRRDQRKTSRIPRRHPAVGTTSPVPHQRHPGSVQDRGRADGAGAERFRSAQHHREHADLGAGAGGAARHRTWRARSTSASEWSAPTSAR